MGIRHAMLAGLLVVGGATLLSVPVAGATDAGARPATAQTNTTGQNVTFGTQITSFMQASAAETNGSVDAGMWDAAFDTATNKTAAVTGRIRTLEQRRNRLETRLAALEAREENGTLPTVAYTARATELTTRITVLTSAINDTDTAATRAGIDETRLDHLRTDVRNMSRGQVPQFARTIPAANPRASPGPPAATGRPGRRADPGPPNATAPGSMRARAPNQSAGLRGTDPGTRGNPTATGSKAGTAAERGNNGQGNGGKSQPGQSGTSKGNQGDTGNDRGDRGENRNGQGKDGQPGNSGQGNNGNGKPADRNTPSRGR